MKAKSPVSFRRRIARVFRRAAKHAMALISLAVLTASASPGHPQAWTNPDVLPAGLSAADWSGIRRQVEQHRHAAVLVDGAHQARNPGQQWLTRFDGRGFLTQPDAGDWTWGLKLERYGFVGFERPVTGQARVRANGMRLTYDWDVALQEWFINDRRGLEHGFTVGERPADAPLPVAQSSTLNLLMSVRGGLRPELAPDGRDVRFVDAHGATVLTYTGLTVIDADGHTLAAWFEVVDKPCDSARSNLDTARPETSIPIPALRLVIDERGARYPLTIDPVAQQAYLKASNTGAGDLFGFSVAISGDTLVVGAPDEDSAATGVNGDQSNNSAPSAGAAYVFVRNGATWTQQAYLKASNMDPADSFGHSVAISANTLVVGAPGEASAARGVDGNENDNSVPNTGAAYVFVRSDAVWSQQAYLKPTSLTTRGWFGWSVAICGDSVVVGATYDNNYAGAAYVFQRNGTTWTDPHYLKASNADPSDQFGSSVAICGNTVVVGAPWEASKATGVNGDERSNNTFRAGAAYVFVPFATTWFQHSYLKASNTGWDDSFGSSVAISGDTIVVGAPYEDSAATGVNGNQNDNNAFSAGAAYVFVRSRSAWSQEAYLKASDTGGHDNFGAAVAASGDRIVVGARGEDSAATGVNGDQTDNTALSAGATYVFVRSGSAWSQDAYLKASNTIAHDRFGMAVAVSGDTVVVGAPEEDSGTTGVNGNQSDNSAESAGAVYVFAATAPAPALAVSPTTLSRNCAQGQIAASQSFEVWNSGGGTLSYTISESIAWLSCTPTSGTSTGERDTITVNYGTASLAPGTYNGTITVSTTGGSASPQTVMVTLNVSVPVSTLPASLVTWQSATLNGRVNPKGVVTIGWFEYQAAPFGAWQTTPSADLGGGNTDVTYSHMLDSLTESTTYRYRAVVSNTLHAIARGSDLYFTTSKSISAPQVTTGSTDSLSDAGGARLFGEVIPNGATTFATFAWGKTTLYGHQTRPQPVGNSFTPLAVQTQLTGLEPDTQYHYRLEASNEFGLVVGADRTFTTPPSPSGIMNLIASQRPGTKTVDIHYDLLAPSGSVWSVTLAISTNGGLSFDLPVVHVGGDGHGSAITPGIQKAIAWDAGADWNNHYSANVYFKVIADRAPDSLSRLSGATPVDTQNRTASLSGRVRTAETGTFLAGATVSVGDYSTTTAADGSYSFKDLPMSAGRLLIIEAEGHDPYTVQLPARSFADHTVLPDGLARLDYYPGSRPVPIVTSIMPDGTAYSSYLPSSPSVSLEDMDEFVPWHLHTVTVDWGTWQVPGEVRNIEVYFNGLLCYVEEWGLRWGNGLSSERSSVPIDLIHTVQPPQGLNTLTVVAVANTTSEEPVRSEPFSITVTRLPIPPALQSCFLRAHLKHDRLHYRFLLDLPPPTVPTQYSMALPLVADVGVNLGSQVFLDYDVASGYWRIGPMIEYPSLEWGTWKQDLPFVARAWGVASAERGFDFDQVNMSIGFDEKAKIVSILLTDWVPGGQIFRVLDVLNSVGIDINSIQRIDIYGLFGLHASLEFSYGNNAFKNAVVTPTGGVQALYGPNLGFAKLKVDVTGTLSFPLRLTEPQAWKVTGEVSLGLKVWVWLVLDKKWRWAVLSGEIASSGNWDSQSLTSVPLVLEDGSLVLLEGVMVSIGTSAPRPMARDYLLAGPEEFLPLQGKVALADRLPETFGLDGFRRIGRGPGTMTRVDGRVSPHGEEYRPMDSEDSEEENIAQADLVLVRNGFPFSDPALDAYGEELMLLYVADNGISNSLQYTDIRWTFWDGTDWSVPEAIRTDTQAEFAPQVKYDGNGDAIAVWQRVADPDFTQPDDAATEEELDIVAAMAAEMEIVWSRWSRASRSWSEPVALTSNGHLDHSPLLCGPIEDGTLLLAWTENRENSLMGTAGSGSDTVLWCKWNPAVLSWTEPRVLVGELGFRLSQSLAGAGNSAIYAWTQDMDGNINTQDDQEVFYSIYSNIPGEEMWTQPHRFTTNDVPDRNIRLAVSGSGATFAVWHSGSDLVLDRDFSGDPQIVRHDSQGVEFSDYTMTLGPAGNLVLLWQGLSAAGMDAHYSVYDPISDTWSKDDLLSGDTPLERSFAAVWDNLGNLTVAYNKEEILYADEIVQLEDGGEITLTDVPQMGRVDLVITKRALIKDLALSEGEFIVTGVNYLPGDALALSATALNSGNVAVSDVVVSFYLGDPSAGGTLLADVMLPGWFGAGMSQTAMATWVVPEPASPHTLYAAVNWSGRVTEFDAANNLQSVSIGGTDLAASLVRYQVETNGAVRVIAQVQNLGAPAAGETLLALRREGETNAPLATAQVPALEPGRLAQVALDLPAGTQRYGEGFYRLFVNESGTVMDVNSENDTAAFVVMSTSNPFGPSLWFDFNGPIPVEVSLAGDARIEDGVVRLTEPAEGQQGSVIVATQDVYAGFRASFLALIGDGTETPADGMSFCFGTDLAGSFGEEGAGNGLIVSFDTYLNEDDIAPAIEVRWQGQTLAVREVPIVKYRPARFVGVQFELSPEGEVSVWYDGEWIHEGVLIPNYIPLAGPGRFGIGARTGGLNSKHWVDDLCIEMLLADPSPKPLTLAHRYRFNEPPGSKTVTDLVGDAHGTVLGTTHAFTGTELQLFGRGTSVEAGSNPHLSYVDLPNGLISNIAAANNAITFEVWFTWDGPADSHWQRVLDFGDTVDGVEGVAGQGYSYLFLTPNAGVPGIRWAITTDMPATGEILLHHEAATPLGEPQHVVVTYDGDANVSRLFVNAVLVATDLADRPLSGIRDINNWLGRSQWAADPLFNGQLNELRIYTGIMEPSQVAANYARGPEDAIGEVWLGWNISPPGGGTITANPAPGGDGKYAAGTVVTLTATANPGYAFSHWSGNASGSDSTTTVTMAEDRSVMAIFRSLGPLLCLDFDGSLPTGVSLEGDARIEDGVVRLTEPAEGQQGSVIVATDDVYTGFRVSFLALIGDGTEPPADGMSFCFGTDLAGSFGEEGAGNGLIVSFDTYLNEDDIAPAIEVRWQGQTLAVREVPIVKYRPAQFVGVQLDLTPEGEVSVWYDGEWIHEGVLIPNYIPLAGPGRFGIGARTGDLNSKHWVDDLCIEMLGMPETYGLWIAVNPPDTDTITLIWPVLAAHYVVEVSHMIGDDAAWEQVRHVPLQDGAFYRLTLPVDQAAQYYRLRK
jgi:hypothetical protein